MSIQLVREWSRVAAWNVLSELREQYHAANSKFKSADQCHTHEEKLRIRDEALEEIDRCVRLFHEAEKEHRAILQFVEREALDLLGAVPLIPTKGPTPEDAANRAQAMAGVLASLLARGTDKKKGVHPRAAAKAKATKLFMKLRNTMTAKEATAKVNQQLGTTYERTTLSRNARTVKAKMRIK